MSTPTTRVMHRSLRATPPKAVSGEGVWLIAEGGHRVLDASGGAAVSCLGHQNPRVIAAMAEQGPSRGGTRGDQIYQVQLVDARSSGDGAKPF